MKKRFRNEISNWRLTFITLAFMAVMILTLRGYFGIKDSYTKYMYYLIYILIALSYSDLIWKKFKKRESSEDILDD